MLNLVVSPDIIARVMKNVRLAKCFSIPLAATNFFNWLTFILHDSRQQLQRSLETITTTNKYVNRNKLNIGGVLEGKQYHFSILFKHNLTRYFHKKVFSDTASALDRNCKKVSCWLLTFIRVFKVC